MAHVNLEILAQQPQRETEEFNRLDAKAREMMNNSSGDPLSFLEECIKEVGRINPQLAARLSASRAQIEQEITITRQRQTVSSPIQSQDNSKKSAVNEVVKDSGKESTIRDIGILQGSALGALAVLVTANAAAIFDQNGDEILPDQLQRKSASVVKFNDEAQTGGFLGILGDIYSKFTDLGFKTKVSKKERVDEQGEVLDSAHYFAVALPKEYKGNKDPMKMSEEQIREALSIYERDTNQEMDYFSVVVGSMAKEMLMDFQQQENRGFVKDLMSESGVPKISTETRDNVFEFSRLQGEKALGALR